MDTPGLTFAPIGQTPGRPNAGDSPDPNRPSTPIQDAIRVLSLRVPRVLGAQAPVDPSLFARPGQPAGGGRFQVQGTPDDPSTGLDEILRRLFGLSHMGPGTPTQPTQGGWPDAPSGPPSPQISFPVLPPNPGPIDREPDSPAPSPVQQWDTNTMGPVPELPGHNQNGSPFQ